MSEVNVEIVRAAIEAANRGDWVAALKDAGPDFEFDMSRAVGPVTHGVYGLDQARRTLEEFTGTWESFRYEANEFIEAGDRVVTPFTSYFRGRHGIEVQAHPAWVWTIRDGVLERLCLYQTRQEALEAAALSE